MVNQPWLGGHDLTGPPFVDTPKSSRLQRLDLKKKHSERLTFDSGDLITAVSDISMIPKPSMPGLEGTARSSVEHPLSLRPSKGSSDRKLDTDGAAGKRHIIEFTSTTVETTEFTPRTFGGSELRSLGSKITLQADQILRRKNDGKHATSGAQSASIIPKPLSVTKRKLQKLDGNGVPVRRRTLPARKSHRSPFQRKIQMYMPSTLPVPGSRAVIRRNKDLEAGVSAVLNSSHLPVGISPRRQKTVRKYNLIDVLTGNARSVLPVAEQLQPRKNNVYQFSFSAATATISSSTPLPILLQSQKILKLMTSGEPASKDLRELGPALREHSLGLLPSKLDVSHHLNIGIMDLEGLSQHATTAISSAARKLKLAKRSNPPTFERGLPQQPKDESLSQPDAGSLIQAADVDNITSMPVKKARRPGPQDMSQAQSDPLPKRKTKKVQAADEAYS
jgi:hypothetical protein